MAKRRNGGRPRKTGEREPNGRLQRVPPNDRGTEQLQRRKLALAGNGDPNLTWHPLGTLRANSAISETEYHAGCVYFALYEIVFRKVHPTAVALDGGARGLDCGDPSEEETRFLTRCKTKLSYLMAAVDRIAGERGRIAKDEWDSLVIHMREPRWMRPVMPSPADVANAAHFRAVIREVTAQLTGEVRRAA